jgi:hypothetical protein
MGQYHRIMNLSKHEFIHPHKLGCGLKLREQANTQAGTLQALFAALACSNGRGGGDFSEHEWVGRWKGDQIAVIGDYSEPEDLPKPHDAKLIYDACHDEHCDLDDPHTGVPCFKDVSDLACDFLEKEWGFKFSNEEGWRDRKWNDGRKDNPGLAPDMVIRFPKG